MRPVPLQDTGEAIGEAGGASVKACLRKGKTLRSVLGEGSLGGWGG